MLKMMTYFGLCFFLTLVGCQMAPTKVGQATHLDSSLLNRLESPVVIDEFTVIVDARPTFDFNMSHVPGAISLQWEEFAQPNGPYRGKVNGDLNSLVKRLALKGIHPKKRIVVVGNGKLGNGEEGRVAWSLMHLGFREVEIAKSSQFQQGMANVVAEMRPNEAAWPVQVESRLEASKAEVLAVATKKLEPNQRVSEHILDVRTRKEYMLKKGLGEGYVSPDIRAVHIPWDQFIDDFGRPNKKVRVQMLALGWELNDRIVVISDHGVRSGLVAFCLSTIGFQNVANFTGGYAELLDSKSKGPKLRPLGK